VWAPVQRLTDAAKRKSPNISSVGARNGFGVNAKEALRSATVCALSVKFARQEVSMNDVRRKEIRRALSLIGEAKGIIEVVLTQEQDDFDNLPDDVQDGEDGQRAEDAVDALERAAMCCDDAITACEEAIQE
jgi:hypothetical protein